MRTPKRQTDDVTVSCRLGDVGLASSLLQRWERSGLALPDELWLLRRGAELELGARRDRYEVSLRVDRLQVDTDLAPAIEALANALASRRGEPDVLDTAMEEAAKAGDISRLAFLSRLRDEDGEIKPFPHQPA